ncbi:similar to developmental protein fluG [Plenodomus lingam JN3]|uniref:Similar to developmental protein fluG n=1 Tax=Leptosphaeria maculans (strain JN3 / isolate v23.1.3 / race Av1-4-5-6-7-8) TaxID=985895 RepID=E5A3G5_LEPMJ|nr:similar to developmental protein fluG [Plenodomus lingam JN3]CBX98178.1 similar to developmental protein fluG [Plenodomus lingam JN3]
MDPYTPLPRPTVEQLRHVAKNYPIIDNHAHNLILPTHADTIPFETITTEAQGRALRDTFKTLSHLRAAKHLRQLYECGEDADWEDILEQRIEWLRSDPERLHQRCFEGVHALLIDDGLAGPEKVFPYEHHDQYTTAPCKRIVRIEKVAERLMERLVRKAKEDDLAKTKFLTDIWVAFTDNFEGAIQDAIADPEVAGFKTVICYRTGLDIEPDYEEAAKVVGHPFERYVKNCIRKRSYRIEKKALNDYIVLRTLEILSEQVRHSDAFTKPLQFHTGLGDNDISLLESNPAFLQPLIENYPTVPFVLLHSAYPYTREAGYLATVYRHVYLDIGEVFPMLSRDGQGAVLRQAMELVPGSKLMYSSDGHWFPETFWLANLQFREVWLDVLLEYVEKGDLTPFQAMGMTKDILFNNANVLYDLRYEVIFDERVPEVPKQLTFSPKVDPRAPQQSPTVLPVHDASPSGPATNMSTPSARPVSPYPPSSFPPPPKVPQVYDVQILDDFKQKNPAVKFVYVQWLDYMATVRARIVTLKEFERMVRAGERIGISQGNTGTLQNDSTTPVVNTTGQIYVEPDLRSLRKTHNKDPLPSATVLCYWRNESGKALVECPRNGLENLVSDLQYNYGTSLLVGFEIEVTFLNRSRRNAAQPYSSLTTTHAWSTLSPEQWLQLPFLSEIVLALEEMDIEVQQFHAESGKGQYEFILAPLPALPAVDTLIQARQVITQIAEQHDMRATLHPKPFAGIGTAAHAHISLQPPDRDMQFFVGGVLQHLPAICAFTMPCEESYERVMDDSWTGGTWIAWGTQNRETPLRRIGPGHWELRTLDGLANMYLALSCVIAAGLLGVQSAETAYPQLDLPFNPATLDEDARRRYGVLQQLPRNLHEALDAMDEDGALKEALGHRLVQHYVAMKESERKMLGQMEEEERRVFLIERY